MKPRILALLPLAALLAACATQPAGSPTTIAETIARDPQLSTLNGLVAKAGLTETLKAAGPYTLFAPTNAAFQSVPAKTFDELAGNPARLKEVLSYHVVPAKLTAASVKPGNVKSAQGANLALARAGDFVTVEEAMVEKADIVASNGIVHKVDRVLMPPRR